MRLLSFALLVACGKKEDEIPLPPPISFADSAPAFSVQASIDDDSANLLEVWGAVGAFLDLLLSDNTIKSTFYVDANLTAPALVYYIPCWALPSAGTAGFSYDVDLGGCSSEGYDGTLHVENTSQGPIVLTFNGVQYLDWTLTGSLAFAYGDDRTWSVYPSDADAAPTGALSVNAPGGTVNLTFDGTMQFALFPSAQIQWAGTAGDGVHSLNVGDGDVSSYDQQPASCRCPASGGVATDVTVSFSLIEVDLDALEVDDNGVDDGLLAFSANGPAGEAVFLATTTCGVSDVLFGGAEVALDSAALDAGVTAACDGGVFDDGTCTRLHEAASQGQVTITLGANEVDRALTESASQRFDEGLCVSGY